MLKTEVHTHSAGTLLFNKHFPVTLDSSIERDVLQIRSAFRQVPSLGSFLEVNGYIHQQLT